MISANGGTYAGQYPCEGRVDDLEPNLLITIICFLIQGNNLKKTINHYLQDKKLIISY